MNTSHDSEESSLLAETDGGGPARFSPEIASVLGLRDAILLQIIKRWLAQDGSRRAGPDGTERDWVSIPMSTWEEEAPWWTGRTIRRGLDDLEEKGLILTGRFKEESWDQTKFYAINIQKIKSQMPEVGRALDAPLVEYPKGRPPGQWYRHEWTQGRFTRTGGEDRKEDDTPLPQGRTLLFDAGLAERIGTKETFFLETLWREILRYGGRPAVGPSGKERDWIIRSYREWLRVLPDWSRAKAMRTVQSLEEKNLIVATQIEERYKGDKRNWFAINWERARELGWERVLFSE